MRGEQLKIGMLIYVDSAPLFGLSQRTPGIMGILLGFPVRRDG